VAGELRRQSSQKDLQIGVLAAQLDEKDQQLQLETDINTKIVANLRASEHELRRQTSEKDLMIERLTAELNESRGVGKLVVLDTTTTDDETTTTSTQQDQDNEWMVEKFQKKAHDQLKSERTKTKQAKDSKTSMAKLRKKLAQERSKLKREQQQVQALKRAVVKESIQSVAVMSGLRDLLEQLQQKIADLETENATLKSSVGVI
jgi:ABC-type Fe2+-enterobactin transport system substrate-binding protein